MPRGKIGDDVMKVRFGDGTFARIDAVASNRSEFIRGAVEAALGGDTTSVEKPASVPVRKSVPQKKNSIVPSSDKAAVNPKLAAAPSGRQADAAAVLGVIRSKRLTSRQAEAEMGWLGLRYANAEKLLLSSGAAAVVDGHLVAT